ncbi:conserved hypothetical protein [Heliomicrobium modesticaldum Ice1]|uniref:YcdB/YcdC repeated domain-containing protein n=1 Tax=Heliobacterium modesticaldum (strain ATCC 51547 / Ice1) TaxID=498761 RepID=B0TAZ3_HELMI|nr:PepSY domain-containing protein [Heliomicrobium modesticaldum]ABZ85104.1 conserved hypothetical protein [Heliomicrobium modesticaldum Ice1]
MVQRHTFRRCLAGCLSVCLLAGVAPAVAAEPARLIAAPDGQMQPTLPEKAPVTLEQALVKAKEAFPPPPEYTNFQSAFSGYGRQTVWSLSWRPENNTGFFEVSVDAVTGEIVAMNQWKEQISQGRPDLFPTLPLDKAREKAWRLVQQLNPTKAENLRLHIDGLNGGVIRPEMERRYHFIWQRTHKGIPFPGNTITVEIDANSGDVTSYHVNWTTQVLPDAHGVISLQKAREIYEKAGMLELQYYLPRTPDGKATKEAQLIYRLQHPSNGQIDAFTGQPVKPYTPDWKFTESGAGGFGSLAKSAAQELTLQENREIELTGKLLSRDKALQAVKKWFDLPQGAELRGAHLGKYDENSYAWMFDWEGSPEKQIPFVNARVNAETGELIEYYLHDPNDYNQPGGDLPREEAQKIGEAFLQKIQPDRLAQTRLNNNVNEMTPIILKGKVPANHSFLYRRHVQDVPYPENFISISVNTKTKKITGYQMRWSSSDRFATPQNILSPSGAVDAFLKYRPLTLTYTQNFTEPGKEAPISLVYVAQDGPNGYFYEMIDARSGKPLRFDGQPMEPPSGSFRFNDIADHPLVKEISLLGQMNAFREYGDALHPDQPVTAVSLLRSIVITRPDYYREDKPSDGEIMQRARTIGLLAEPIQAGDVVSRELLAKWMVRMLKLEPAARLQSIYQLPHEDAASLSAESKGHVAIAWGLGLLPVDAEQLEPSQPVTRLEAAISMVKAFKVK